MTGSEPLVVVHETHTGLVVLLGDRAYKIKKPIATDFLDFSTHDLREKACARELELNRRLCPDIYLGVGHLTDPTGGAPEPVLIMRRLPDSQRLSALLDDPDRMREALSALVMMLAKFHDEAARGPDIDRAGTTAALRERWWSLLQGLTDQPVGPGPGTGPAMLEPRLVRQLSRLVMRYLAGRKPLFDRRIEEGRIVDGHGDMHAGDIFALPDGFRVIDCLDFDDELRHVDRLDDMAFLAMDLEFLGHPELGERLLDEYSEVTSDRAPASLRHHYLAYRAVVRAKVNAIRYTQGDAEARAHALRHVSIALDHLERGAIRLALVGGLPGTGKSTVAQGIAAHTDAVVISTDRLRAGLRAAGSVAGESGTYGAGVYGPAAKDRVYEAMLAEAHGHLVAGRSVVLDASWIADYHRIHAAALAAEASAVLIEFDCIAPQPVAAERIMRRSGSDSEATPMIAAAMAGENEPWPAATQLDTMTSIAETMDRALQVWRSATNG